MGYTLKVILTVICVSISSGFLIEKSTCSGRCNRGLDKTKDCQCNHGCISHKDCCPDYHQICDSGVSPTIADKLWNVDGDKFKSSDFKLNAGGQAQMNSTTDRAPAKLFSYVNTAKLNTPLYKALMALWDNYTPTRGAADPVTAADKIEIDHFLDLVMASPVMDETYKYLLDRKIIQGSKASFRSQLYSIWFDPYSRTGHTAPDSSGFEHVFVGEYKGTKVEGLHSWVRMYKEELAGHFNYLGHYKYLQPRFLSFTYQWNSHEKRLDEFIMGSSPVFDMAISTICILSNPNNPCQFSLNGQSFKIMAYDDSKKAGLQIGTAFVEI